MQLKPIKLNSPFSPFQKGMKFHKIDSLKDSWILNKEKFQNYIDCNNNLTKEGIKILEENFYIYFVEGYWNVKVQYFIRTNEYDQEVDGQFDAVFDWYLFHNKNDVEEFCFAYCYQQNFNQVQVVSPEGKIIL